MGECHVIKHRPEGQRGANQSTRTIHRWWPCWSWKSDWQQCFWKNPWGLVDGFVMADIEMIGVFGYLPWLLHLWMILLMSSFKRLPLNPEASHLYSTSSTATLELISTEGSTIKSVCASEPVILSTYFTLNSLVLLSPGPSASPGHFAWRTPLYSWSLLFSMQILSWIPVWEKWTFFKHC